MRAVDRSSAVPPPEWLLRAADATQRALQQKGSHKASSNIYGDPALKVVLEELFLDKCAYCEIEHAGCWDVEHYRPAHSVKEASKHPGYYWLAYEWSNLLPACKACNQRLTDPHEPDKRGQGKQDQFPILDESKRAYEPSDDLAIEERLILNPCLDDPCLHLQLLPTGKLEAKGGSLIGETTIRVLGLNKVKRQKHRQKYLGKFLQFHKDGQQVYLSDALQDHAQYVGLIREFSKPLSTQLKPEQSP